MPSLKIAKTGHDVNTITDPRNFIFSTDYDYLKESSSGLVDTDSGGNVTITHSLGYVPAFIVFAADSADLTKWSSYDAMTSYATTTSVVIQNCFGGIQSKVFYIIFSSQV